MKTPQIVVDRLKAIVDEEQAQHIANIIELANDKKLKDDFAVIPHIIEVLRMNDEETINLLNFDYTTIKKPITRKMSEETARKRYELAIKKAQEKYGIKE